MSMIVEKRVASWLGGPHGGIGHLGVDYVMVLTLLSNRPIRLSLGALNLNFKLYDKL
jgi:hypothetical protein